MTRRRRIVLGAGVILVVALGGLLWALPEIVRRTAVTQIAALTGRAISIADVDLNLLTGRFAVRDLRLAEREGPEALVALERLDGRLSLLSLLLADIRLTELTLTGPTVRVVRTGAAEFNFSDLLPLFLARDPAKPPGRWTVTVDRLSLERGAVLVKDRAVSPPADWSLTGLSVDGAALTTRAGRAAGRLAVRARMGGAALEVMADPLYLAPVSLTARVTLDAFELARGRPYLPAALPALPESGTLALALTVAWERDPDRIKTASVTGEVRLEGLSLVQRGRSAPFVTVPRLTVQIREADLVGRQVVLERVEVDGLRAVMARDRAGRIDVLEALGQAAVAPAEPGPAQAPAPAAAAGQRLRVERLALGAGSIAFTDEAVSPSRQWRLDELAVEAQGLSTSADDEPGRATVHAMLSAGDPERRRAELALDARALRLVPAAASLRVALTGFDLSELRDYVPAGAPVSPGAGVVDLSLAAEVARGEGKTARAAVSGDVKVAGLALSRGAAAAPFASASRITVGIREADLLSRAITLGAVTAEGVDVRLVRDASGRVDAVAAAAPASPAQPGPSSAPAAAGSGAAVETGAPPAPPFTVRLERLALRSGGVSLVDEGVSPARQWRLEGISVDVAGLSTSPKDPPGTLRMAAALIAAPGAGPPATLGLEADALRLAPLTMSGRLTLQGFALAAATPYLPPGLPATPEAGRLALDLRIAAAQGAQGLSQAKASGSVTVTELALSQRGQPAPFLRVPRLAIGLTGLDALARTVTLGTVEVEDLDLRAVRDPAGVIDVLALAAPPASDGARPPAADSQPGPARAAGSEARWKVSLDRFALVRGRATFEDRAVTPITTLPVTDLAVTAEHLTWPAVRQGKLAVSAGLPGGGLLLVEGAATLEPLDLTVSISTLDAPIQPYHAYFPFRARFAGLFSGDSLSAVKVEDGRLIAASQGNAWIKDFQVIPPDSTNPVIHMERMEIRGIDFAWPTYAFVDRVSLLRPEVRIERDPQGVIDLRRMFEVQRTSPPAGEPAVAVAAAPPRKDGPKRPGLLETMVLDFREIVVEEGYARFLDRTTRPVFSQDVARLAVTLRGLSNAPGRRATLSAQAIVGGDAALDLRGEVSRLGEDLFADLVGELRDFSLASTTPYTDSLLSWIVRRGRLAVKVHYRVEKDRISGTHDIVVRNLEVARGRAADEVERRVGLPLGLVVALLKDTRGDITLSVPLHGSLSDRRFDWGEAIWSAVKQVVVKVLAAPFRAIGRLFTGGGDKEEKIEALAVDPVTFAPGSSVLGPAMEGHLARVSEFLRRSPFVKLALAPVVTARDAERLKAQELTARIQRVQRERGIADFAMAVGAYYRDRAIAGPPPTTPEEQLRILTGREPLPEERVTELLERRLVATREALTRIEGVPAERLRGGDPQARLEDPGEGRVEFAIVAD